MADKLHLTPLDIVNKKFSIDFKGYESNEVDHMLDEVIEDYQMYQDMVDSLQQKVSDLEKTNALLRARMVELEGKERAISKDSNPMLQGANNVDILKRLSKLENEVFNNNNDSNRKH